MYSNSIDTECQISNLKKKYSYERVITVNNMK